VLFHRLRRRQTKGHPDTLRVSQIFEPSLTTIGAMLLGLLALLIWALLAKLHSLVTVGCSLIAFTLGWFLAERNALQRYVEAVHRLLQRTTKYESSEAEGTARSAKAAVGRLRKLVREGTSLKVTHSGFWGFFVTMAAVEWYEEVLDEVAAVCGENSVEHSLVVAARRAPDALWTALERPQEPSIRDIIMLLLGDRSQLGSLIGGGFAGMDRAPDALRNFEIDCTLHAIRTVIHRLRHGYGPVTLGKPDHMQMGD